MFWHSVYCNEAFIRPNCLRKRELKIENYLDEFFKKPLKISYKFVFISQLSFTNFEYTYRTSFLENKLIISKLFATKLRLSREVIKFQIATGKI